MPTSNFQPIRLLNPHCCYRFTYLMANSADKMSCFFRSRLIWIYTVCKGRVYQGSARLELNEANSIARIVEKGCNYFHVRVFSLGSVSILHIVKRKMSYRRWSDYKMTKYRTLQSWNKRSYQQSKYLRLSLLKNILLLLHDTRKTCLFKYTENFTIKKKNENFQLKHSVIFHISAQNIDCGYSL